MKKILTTSLFVTTIILSGCGNSDDKKMNESNSQAPLSLLTYTPGENAIFAVASTVITGQKDAILVDAQFQNQHAKEVVNLIKKSGKNLKYIYISHSDPDYYFGTNEILKAFPNAKVVSTAQTAYLIQASKDDKLAVWQPQFPQGDAPEKIIIPEALNTGYLELDGQKIQVESDPEDTAHSFLWIPSLKTALGGISVSYDAHLWMADTNGVKGINLWTKQLDKILSLKPEQVIPGHYIKSDFSPKPLDWIKGYLSNFKTAVTENKTSTEIVNFMKNKYPDLADEDTLKMSAQVFTKEIDWKVASPYPAIGQKIQVDFKNLKFDLDVKDHQNLIFTGAGGEVNADVSESVKYTPVEIAKNIFMVYWHEDKSGDNVVHVQDYNRDVVYTNIAEKTGNTIHLTGKISGVKGVIKDPELQQPLNKPFFAIGQTLLVNVAGQTQRLQFVGQKNLNIINGQNTSTTVEYSAIQVGPDQFMVYWNDAVNKRNVVVVLDQKANLIYQNVATFDGKFSNSKGEFETQSK